MDVSPSSALEDLPLDLVEYICELLVQCGDRRSSLFAFSRASKRCCDAAARQRFERIHFTVRGQRKLLTDIKRWNNILQMGHRIGYVRRVKLSGYELELEDISQGDDEFEPERVWTKPREIWEFRDDDFCACPSVLEIAFEGSDPNPTAQERQSHNEAWLPMAAFISKLPRLTDLVHQLTDPIPLCILSAVHQHHPQSRLHVHAFSFRSLYFRRSQPSENDPAENALVTSPCLYSIQTIQHMRFDDDADVGYNEQTLLRMVVDQAPRLRRVMIHYNFMFDNLGGLESRQESNERAWNHWPGFFDEADAQSRPNKVSGRLESLSFDGMNSEASNHIGFWKGSTDFTLLRNLEFNRGLTVGALQTLAHWAETGAFPSLQSFALVVDVHLDESGGEVDETVAYLISALSPLERLELTGTLGRKSFASISHHESALRHLRFSSESIHGAEILYPVTPERVRQLQNSCPNIVRLELTIPRTRGDMQEARIYRALGEFTKLTHLSLKLDICRPTNTHELPIMHLRELALDSTLALSIFRTIRGGDRSALQCLHLETSGDNNHILGRAFEFGLLEELLSPRWICKTKSKDSDGGAAGDGRAVVEYAVRASCPPIGKEGLLMSPVYERYKRLWQYLWPSDEEAWWEHWKSLPLDLSVADSRLSDPRG